MLKMPLLNLPNFYFKLTSSRLQSDINATTLQCVMGDKRQIFLKAFRHATQTSFTKSLDNNHSGTPQKLQQKCLNNLNNSDFATSTICSTSAY